jgi:hypothetical protein
VAYLPAGQGDDLTADALARTFAVTRLDRPAAGLSPAAPASPVATAPAGRTRRQADVLHTRLDGVDLLVRRKPGVPLVALGIYVPKPEFDPPAQAGLGALLVRSAIRGAGDYDAGALAFAFERLGGTLSPAAASDWLGFGASVLADRLGQAAVLLDTVFTAPHLRGADIGRARAHGGEAEQVAGGMFRYPFQLAFSAAYGEAGPGPGAGRRPRSAGHRAGRRGLARARCSACDRW